MRVFLIGTAFGVGLMAAFNFGWLAQLGFSRGFLNEDFSSAVDAAQADNARVG